MPTSADQPRPRPRQPQNLFAHVPMLERGEEFQTLARREGVHIERIVSSPEPAPVLYNQDSDEWVLLLQGYATLDLDGTPVELTAGDHLLIPAHLPHRVVATSTSPCCVWVAVHLPPAT
jgi:cupin 2 domain-containing protein